MSRPFGAENGKLMLAVLVGVLVVGGVGYYVGQWNARGSGKRVSTLERQPAYTSGYSFRDSQRDNDELQRRFGDIASQRYELDRLREDLQGQIRRSQEDRLWRDQ